MSCAAVACAVGAGSYGRVAAASHGVLPVVHGVLPVVCAVRACTEVLSASRGRTEIPSAGRGRGSGRHMQGIPPSL